MNQFTTDKRRKENEMKSSLADRLLFLWIYQIW